MTPNETRKEPLPVALIGLSGAGKTTVARLVAGRLGAACIDLDARIESEAGATIADIMEREGEAGFRARESATLAAVVDAGDAPIVIACGGGIVTSPEARACLAERCRVVWLEVSPWEAIERMGKTAGARPLLHGGGAEARLKALLAERADHYATVAHGRVPTSARTPASVADAVVAALQAMTASDPT